MAMTGLGERPRELKWYHAGPMLFGDWGTSRLYVLGLAFAFTHRASFWFIAAMCVLMIGVGWCYTIACRLFPDGGGVYSSAKMRSQLLALIGALLLCADYVVTASISCLDAFHYLGLNHIKLGPIPLDAVLAFLTILAVGWLNFFGPTKTGVLAMWIAVLTIILTMVIGVACIPYLGQARIESPLGMGVGESWIKFTEIILALSGVEAIANMTGIMVQPVGQTAKKSIWLVMTEIVILNLILAAAMCALPDSILFEKQPGSEELAHTGDMLKQIASYYVHPTFAAISSLVFALLLLSAVNTAIGALVSVLFMLSRDHELPESFAKLNRYGMPKWPLAVAMVTPAILVVIFPNVESLASMYAVGTVGAIAIDLGSIATNRKITLRGRERWPMLIVALILTAVEGTILVVKPEARGFALIVLVCGLAGRLVTLANNPDSGLSSAQRKRWQALAAIATIAIFGSEVLLHNKPAGIAISLATAAIITGASFRTQGWRDRIVDRKAAVTDLPSKRPMMVQGAYKPKSRIMVATQGNPRLLKFAFEESKKHQAELQLLFIRHLAVTPMGPVEVQKLDEDQDALRLFEQIRQRGQDEGVPIRLVYGVARDIPDAILDMAVTHGADMLLLGATRRGSLWKTMKGDVIQAVAEQLPESVGLLIHA